MVFPGFALGKSSGVTFHCGRNNFGGMGGGRSVLLVSGRLEGRDFTSTLLGREPIKECFTEVRDNGYKHKLSLTW